MSVDQMSVDQLTLNHPYHSSPPPLNGMPFTPPPLTLPSPLLPLPNILYCLLFIQLHFISHPLPLPKCSHHQPRGHPLPPHPLHTTLHLPNSSTYSSTFFPSRFTPRRRKEFSGKRLNGDVLGHPLVAPNE